MPSPRTELRERRRQFILKWIHQLIDILDWEFKDLEKISISRFNEIDKLLDLKIKERIQ